MPPPRKLGDRRAANWNLFLKEQPENSILIGDLALVNMGLGDKAAALALAERGMALHPIEQDALAGSARIEILARVAAGTGEPDRAIAAIQKLLSIPQGRWLHAAHSCDTSARSDVRSAPERSALPKTRRLVRIETGGQVIRRDLSETTPTVPVWLKTEST